MENNAESKSIHIGSLTNRRNTLDREVNNLTPILGVSRRRKAIYPRNPVSGKLQSIESITRVDVTCNPVSGKSITVADKQTNRQTDKQTEKVKTEDMRITVSHHDSHQSEFPDKLSSKRVKPKEPTPTKNLANRLGDNLRPLSRTPTSNKSTPSSGGTPRNTPRGSLNIDDLGNIIVDTLNKPRVFSIFGNAIQSTSSIRSAIRAKQSPRQRLWSVAQAKFANHSKNVARIEATLKGFGADLKEKKPKKVRYSRYRRFVAPMTPQLESTLISRAKRLIKPGKGIIDLVTQDCNEFKEITNSAMTDEQCRHQFLSLYLQTAKDLRLYIHGLLLSDTMLEFDNPRRMVLNYSRLGISLGVKFDEERLDAVYSDETLLYQRLQELKEMGVEFTMGTESFHVTDMTPSQQTINNRCMDLAKFAIKCQVSGLVPIMSVDITHDGDQEMELTQQTLRCILSVLVKAMADVHVYTEGVIIAIKAVVAKPPRVIAIGVTGRPIQQVLRKTEKLHSMTTLEHRSAVATAQAVSQSVPAAVAGILLTNASATNLSVDNRILNELNRVPIPKWPFHVGFCFQHVIQHGFLSIWAGRDINFERACEFLIKRTMMCSDATMGQLEDENKCPFITNVTKFV